MKDSNGLVLLTLVVVANSAMAVAPPEDREERRELAQAAARAREANSDGFHLGVGVGGFGFYALAYIAQATVQGHLDWKWGRVSLRVSPTFRASWVGINALGANVNERYFTATVESQVRFNLGRVFAVGVGVESGALFVPRLTAVSRAFFSIGPSVTPVLLRLGDRGEHQLSLTGSRLFSFPTIPPGSFGFTPGPGELNFSIAYSYLFPS